MGKYVLPGRGKRNTPRFKSHSPEIRSISPLSPQINSLPFRSLGSQSLVRPACRPLQRHTVILPAEEEEKESLAFWGKLTVLSPPAAHVGCSTQDFTHAWHYLDKRAKRSHLTVESGILFALCSFLPLTVMTFWKVNLPSTLPPFFCLS